MTVLLEQGGSFLLYFDCFCRLRNLAPLLLKFAETRENKIYNEFSAGKDAGLRHSLYYRSACAKGKLEWIC